MSTNKKQSEEDRFTSINPNDLPPELLPLYKSMQADYTRKTQEAKAKIEEADEKVKQMEQQLAEVAQHVTQINDYVAALEDANKKWEAWAEQQQQKAQAQPQLTKQEVDVLNMDKSKLSEETLKQLDEYFVEKYGKTLEQLSEGMNKLNKQLSFKLQLDEVMRKYSKELPDIDVGKVVKTAVETGTLDAKEAFERAYAEELREKEVQRRVEQKLKELEEARKTQVLEGSSANIGQHFYVPRTDGPRTYEEATASILSELAIGGGK